MFRVTRAQLLAAFEKVGIQRGDGLLVHSALQYLGQPQGGVDIYLQALFEVLGIELMAEGNREVSTGTLVAPTFNFGFARGERYDPINTPSQGMGVLSELIRLHPRARRTPHPMQSLAAMGYYADDLASRDTLSAFDPGSAFERMLELDFRILLLGADIQAISLLHYAEQHTQVPYRYWKEFTGEVWTPSGWQTKIYRMYVRDLQLDPHIDLQPVQRRLEERQKWSSVRLNYGQVVYCRMVDFVTEVSEFLKKDPWSLVTNPPPRDSSPEKPRG